MRYYFPNYDYPNPRAKLALGRKPEHPEKTHHFRQSVDRLFSHPSVAGIEPTNSEVKGACSDKCAIGATNFFYQWKWNNRSDQLRSLSERVGFLIRPALKRNCPLWNATARCEMQLPALVFAFRIPLLKPTNMYSISLFYNNILVYYLSIKNSNDNFITTLRLAAYCRLQITPQIRCWIGFQSGLTLNCI
jgi:hypothetical protein